MDVDVAINGVIRVEHSPRSDGTARLLSFPRDSRVTLSPLSSVAVTFSVTGCPASTLI